MSCSTPGGSWSAGTASRSTEITLWPAPGQPGHDAAAQPAGTAGDENPAHGCSLLGGTGQAWRGGGRRRGQVRDADGQRGVQRLVAGNPHGDGTEPVEVAGGTAQRVLAGAVEEVREQEVVAAAVAAFAVDDRHLVGSLPVALDHQPFAVAAHGVLFLDGCGAGVHHGLLVGAVQDGGAFHHFELGAAFGAVDGHPVALPRAVGVQRVAQAWVRPGTPPPAPGCPRW